MKVFSVLLFLWINIEGGEIKANGPYDTDSWMRFDELNQSSVFQRQFEDKLENRTTYKSYDTSIHCISSWPIQYPRNVEQVQGILQRAISLGYTVKALGSLHSAHDIICTEGIPISMKKINYRVDNGDGTATFGGGVELIEALKFLEKRNKTLVHVPSFGGMTVAGALGTGSHGSSLRQISVLSEQVLKMTIVDGTGHIKVIDSTTNELDFFRVHLGLLGIVIDVTFQTVPLYKMLIENTEQPVSKLFDGTVIKWAKQYDWFQLWWFHNLNRVIVSKGVYLNLDVPGNASTNLIPNIDPKTTALIKNGLEIFQRFRMRSALKAIENFSAKSLHASVIGKPPIFSENNTTLRNPAVGYGWRLQSNICKKCPWSNDEKSLFPEESSIALDISRFDEVIQMIRNLSSNHPAPFPLNGILIRFSKASSSSMAMTRGRDSFIVEWALPMRKDPYNTAKAGLCTYQAILQELIFNYGGRPYWAKNGLYYTTQTVLNKSLSPTHRQNFIDRMKKYDPNGIFLNKFGRRILGISNELDKNARVTRCALQDYCVCKSSNDCAPFQRCIKINGFPTCRDGVVDK